MKLTGTKHKNIAVNEIEDGDSHVMLATEHFQGYRLYCGFKRVFDFCFAAASLIILSPILLIICLLIKIESKGPAIFKQKRVGKNGKVFTFYKFRSMYTDCDQMIHQQHVQQVVNGNIQMSKVKNDSRITKVGRVLRATIIDELPQLINVIKGDMSLIGPRPHPCYEVEQYKDWHKGRLLVTSGITGLWQINKWSCKSYDDAIRVDLDYIEKASFFLDAKIFIKTVLLFLTPREKL